MDKPSHSILIQKNKPNLGSTLPDILFHAAHVFENAQMFHARKNDSWYSVSLASFKKTCEHVALGLLSLGLEKGDRVALFMDSDTSFAIADMACLLAGLVDVPLYLKQSPGNNEYIIRHSGARSSCSLEYRSTRR